MAIRRGDIIRASDVHQRMKTMVDDLSTELKQPPFNYIFAAETSADFWNRSGLSSQSDETKSHFFQKIESCKNQFDNIAESLNVEKEQLVDHHGFCDFTVSCAALASNIRLAKYLYFNPKNISENIVNASFLQDNVITRNNGTYETSVFEYNYTSNTTVFDYTGYINKYKDTKTSNMATSINDLSGDKKPLYTGNLITAKPANDMISTVYTIDRDITSNLSCKYATDDKLTARYTITYHFKDGYNLTGSATTNGTITDTVDAYTQYSFRSFTNCVNYFQKQGKSLGTKYSGTVGWTKTQASNIDANTKIDYTKGQTIIVSSNIVVYPVYHFTKIYEETVHWDERDIKLNGFELVKDKTIEIGAVANSTVSVDYITVWHNETTHSHEADIVLIDLNNKKETRLLHYSQNGSKCYQGFQDGTIWGRTVGSEFKKSITLRTNENGNLHIKVVFRGNVPSGATSQSIGTIKNFYVKY